MKDYSRKKHQNRKVDSETSSSDNRRSALKKTAAAGAAVAVATKWQKPIVDSVLLPAHAQTSVLPPTFNVEFEVASADAGTFMLIADSGTATLTNADVDDGLSYAVGFTVSPPAATAINIAYDNVDDIDAGPAAGSDITTNDAGFAVVAMATDDLPDNSGADAMQLFTFTPANGADPVSIFLDFS